MTVHDVPSIGIVTRILGWKSGRLHHYLSKHFELTHHYQMEWSEQVIDIREQFPLLPLDKTLYIAQKLGIKHPTDPKNKLPIIMTTDMLLTIKQEESKIYCIFFAKVTREQDELFGLPSGYCMQIVKYLIAKRYWVVDITHLIQPTLQSMIILENDFPSGGISFI
ncbi:TnsA endonuclease N-terminal domain-containing protein [Paenibacillus polymyxa]|uniref:TnsA endonuclease N-terminal domain-containing protein n=1 Tax=Paenibacillus TaxID=44249 RepID=UPI00129B1E71|nr:TnsA endonuclease N-terminal domain-containing protein [Paenibacillus polymyxa]MCJ1223280.1 TnsA endonuclease N-terminal domain-containing protein [Paenibacillus polymyxa]